MRPRPRCEAAERLMGISLSVPIVIYVQRPPGRPPGTDPNSIAARVLPSESLQSHPIFGHCQHAHAVHSPTKIPLRGLCSFPLAPQGDVPPTVPSARGLYVACDTFPQKLHQPATNTHVAASAGPDWYVHSATRSLCMSSDLPPCYMQ